MKSRILMVLFCLGLTKIVFAEDSHTSAKASYLVILGYKLKKDCSPEPALIARLDLALKERNSLTQFIVSGKGTGCKDKTEAEVMKTYLVEKGVHEDKIWVEAFSMTTFENAYYVRLFHIDPNGIKKFTVVTSHFHIERSRIIFGKIFGKDYDIQYMGSENKISAQEVSDIETFSANQMKCYKQMVEDLEPGNLKDWHNFFNSKNAKKRSEYAKCRSKAVDPRDRIKEL